MTTSYIRSLRKSAKLTQQKLAEEAGLCVHTVRASELSELNGKSIHRSTATLVLQVLQRYHKDLTNITVDDVNWVIKNP